MGEIRVARRVSKQRGWESLVQMVGGMEPAPEKGSGKVLPMSVIRDIHHESSSGGRAQCFWCHMSFSMQYMQLCYIGFHNEFACGECRKRHRLQRVGG
jgi:hypothetical protein